MRRELGERDREEGEGRRKMETLVADSERKNREQREEVEEVGRMRAVISVVRLRN